jgi:long-subunit fatty acid transport protein
VDYASFAKITKYDCYDPDKAQTDNITTWYTAGLSYSFNPNVRVQAGYTIKEEQGKSINNNMGVLQFQIGF